MVFEKNQKNLSGPIRWCGAVVARGRVAPPRTFKVDAVGRDMGVQLV